MVRKFIGFGGLLGIAVMLFGIDSEPTYRRLADSVGQQIIGGQSSGFDCPPSEQLPELEDIEETEHMCSMVCSGNYPGCSPGSCSTGQYSAGGNYRCVAGSNGAPPNPTAQFAHCKSNDAAPCYVTMSCVSLYGGAACFPQGQSTPHQCAYRDCHVEYFYF